MRVCRALRPPWSTWTPLTTSRRRRSGSTSMRPWRWRGRLSVLPSHLFLLPLPLLYVPHTCSSPICSSPICSFPVCSSPICSSCLFLLFLPLLSSSYSCPLFPVPLPSSSNLFLPYLFLLHVLSLPIPLAVPFPHVSLGCLLTSDLIYFSGLSPILFSFFNSLCLRCV